MPVALFKVKLSVKPGGGGQAELVVPKVLRELDYHFVIVKDGGAEGIVQVDAPKATIDEIEAGRSSEKLTAKQAQALRESYPPPRLKQRYRVITTPIEAEGGTLGAQVEQYATDDQGKPVVDTYQTVRADFYLIDVPVVPMS
jgi:hypothetical protein